MTIEQIIEHSCEDGRFKVDGCGGVAFYLWRVETAPDADTEWTGEEVPTGHQDWRPRTPNRETGPRVRCRPEHGLRG